MKTDFICSMQNEVDSVESGTIHILAAPSETQRMEGTLADAHASKPDLSEAEILSLYPASRLNPLGFRICARPGGRLRFTRRLLRRPEAAGYFRALTHFNTKCL
ncbi:MAG TPA: hypothetical protein P5186_20395 [Candidatus Paceibacterota bacterium]|nr:hypothetical protein [Verrucomicrobiota bacterium]HRY50419.1 hypothetical protein [Candidatus Paceibacterota bacterium]